MKKALVLTLILAVFLSFSTGALAAYSLAKPSAGQVIFIEADNALDYEAAFPSPP